MWAFQPHCRFAFTRTRYSTSFYIFSQRTCLNFFQGQGVLKDGLQDKKLKGEKFELHSLTDRWDGIGIVCEIRVTNYKQHEKRPLLVKATRPTITLFQGRGLYIHIIFPSAPTAEATERAPPVHRLLIMPRLWIENGSCTCTPLSP
jgi:hypothetical protein